MSFSTKLADSFGKVIDSTPYTAVDPIVKINYIAKGNNVIFGGHGVGQSPHNLIYIGKIFEGAQAKSYLGADAWVNVSFPHVIYVSGTRGSGKSFDLGVLVEGLSSLTNPSNVSIDVEPVSTVLIDMQSQFWTLRYAPRHDVEQNKGQLDALKEWNIQPNSLSNCVIYVPEGGQGFLGDEKTLQIRPRDVPHEDWCRLLGQQIYSPQGHVLGETLRYLSDQAFSIEDMLNYIGNARNFPNIPDASRNAIHYRLLEYNESKLFHKDGLDISDLLKPGQCSVLMLRDLRDEDKSLVTALIARKLFTVMGEYHRQKKVADFFKQPSKVMDVPSKVWLLIDEAHVVAPKDVDSPARDALVEYVKRGRDAGLSLVLATQQPSAVDDRILSQVNLSFNHRLAFQTDIAAAVARVPTKPLSCLKVSGTQLNDFSDMLRLLESGECFLGDHSTSRTVMVKIRPRITAHGGYSPV
ncbi:MAG: Uncharacterized protein FD157_891 [Rhodocyclaceae bacterium]|nr:MAG: Uncharacterized protein FD157_891 [Rhodocyclaceae bacterium]TND05148.1 MAG: Uncharacterized protein FD118_552 [Rhodocyclaceae bacterium]